MCGVEEDESDEEFDPAGKKIKKKPRAKASTVPAAEEARPDAHTLKEHHDFMFSSSFQDNDFAGGFVSLSSQMGGFGLDDNLGDLGAEIGDELARELGWGMPETNECVGLG